jgi:Flp pilus assembly protein TadD
VWVDSGENALAQRRFAAAVAAFGRAAALVPSDAAARRGLAAARAMR